MTSWFGNNFRITGPLWGATGHGCISQRATLNIPETMFNVSYMLIFYSSKLFVEKIILFRVSSRFFDHKFLNISSHKTYRLHCRVLSYDTDNYLQMIYSGMAYYCSENLSPPTTKQIACQPHYPIMMTSSNGNIFRVTGLCAGNSAATGEFPTQRPVTRSFDVFFDLRLNKRLSKLWWGWLF